MRASGGGLGFLRETTRGGPSSGLLPAPLWPGLAGEKAGPARRLEERPFPVGPPSAGSRGTLGRRREGSSFLSCPGAPVPCPGHPESRTPRATVVRRHPSLLRPEQHSRSASPANTASRLELLAGRACKSGLGGSRCVFLAFFKKKTMPGRPQLILHPLGWGCFQGSFPPSSRHPPPLVAVVERFLFAKLFGPLSGDGEGLGAGEAFSARPRRAISQGLAPVSAAKEATPGRRTKWARDQTRPGEKLSLPGSPERREVSLPSLSHAILLIWPITRVGYNQKHTYFCLYVLSWAAFLISICSG